MSKYWIIYCLSIKHSLKNYKSLVGLGIFLVTCLVIFANLWKIAAARIGAIDLPPDLLLWYISLNEWVLIALPSVQEDMEQDLRGGRLAYLLPRPISYLGATFAEATGVLTGNLLALGLMAFAFTWIQTGNIPFGFMEIVLIILFGLLAGCVSVIYQMIIGVTAFWLQEVSPFHWLWEKLMFMLGGLILPLTVYPQWIQTLAKFTPFPSILGDRSYMAFDVSAGTIIAIGSSLLAWGLIGAVGLLIIYRRGLRILNIEGG